MTFEPTSPSRRTLLIATTCTDDWGGSEELWARSIPLLQEAGFDLIVCKARINRLHPQFQQLAARGVVLHELHQPPRNRSLKVRTLSFVRKLGRKLRLPHRWLPVHRDAFTRALQQHRPSLVIVSQGINFDGLDLAHTCLRHKVPYVIVAQKAADFYWPPVEERASMTEAFRHAERCFFVSEHNRRVTEEQFGIRLPNSQVIFNPVKTLARALPYPPVERQYRIACVARLFLLDKGQDMLLRVLAKDKWKQRPVTFSLVGTGTDENGLRAMASLLNVTNVEFAGHQDNIEQLWERYHALVLPSRSEGMPLAMMEAMAAGRPVIVTNAGGNGELVEDGVTGFIGEATDLALEETLERAWQQRACWEEIGEQAAAALARRLPPSPENEFARFIKQITHVQ
ncbi:glycosyltransferase [Paraflavisolibacter sp. H34]|uniref:glycosyltransferase n=1 Tax=Huijunlia imazamoxiresistens TaxID=3127457 RepID=UPI003019B244